MKFLFNSPLSRLILRLAIHRAYSYIFKPSNLLLLFQSLQTLAGHDKVDTMRGMECNYVTVNIVTGVIVRELYVCLLDK